MIISSLPITLGADYEVDPIENFPVFTGRINLEVSFQRFIGVSNTVTFDAIADAIVNALVTNVTIKTYCNTNFAKYHSVHQWATQAYSADRDDYPAFTVLANGKNRDEDAEEWTYSLAVEVAIIDDTATTTMVSGVKKVVYDGPAKLETLLGYAWDAISAIET